VFLCLFFFVSVDYNKYSALFMLYLVEARNVRGFVISDIFAAIKIRGIMPTAKSANIKCAKSFLGIQYSTQILNSIF
jgi:hypothetical protein